MDTKNRFLNGGDDGMRDPARVTSGIADTVMSISREVAWFQADWREFSRHLQPPPLIKVSLKFTIACACCRFSLGNLGDLSAHCFCRRCVKAYYTQTVYEMSCSTKATEQTRFQSLLSVLNDLEEKGVLYQLFGTTAAWKPVNGGGDDVDNNFDAPNDRSADNKRSSGAKRTIAGMLLVTFVCASWRNARCRRRRLLI